MNKALFQLVLAGLLSCSISAANAAWLPVEIEQQHNRLIVVAGGAVSLQQAAATAKKEHGGKVVKAETKSRGGQSVHHIRLVTEGRVKTILIDAATGKQLSH